MENKDYKIMVVDDSKFMRLLLESILKKEGFTVKSYELAIHAKEDIDEFKPHMILSDFMMPEMNGFEFCEIVKKEEKRDIKFILITSVTDVDNKVKCFEAGADDYITKPFNAQEVLARVKTHLRIKMLTDELQKALNKINSELEIVRKIQLSFVPENFPEIENINFTAYYNIMNKTGGDYLDIVEINEDKLSMIVADVEGHGVYSTVFMAIIKTILNTDLKKIYNPGEGLNTLNNDILSLTTETKFATVFYGMIDKKERCLEYANAGHPFPFIINREKGEIEELESKRGFPVGLFPSNPNTYPVAKVNLNKGDRIFIFTDGIIESKNREKELFGEERLKKIIKETLNLPLNEAKNKIIEEVYNYSENIINDDITLLGIEVE